VRTACLVTCFVVLSSVSVRAEDYVEIRRFAATEARQAVTVDEHYFYAIGNNRITKYDKQSGEPVAKWQASDDIPLAHLNSGMVRDGKLYCAHSNFPEYPEVSSVEIWNSDSLQHVRSHRVTDGSLTWIDWHDGAWWAVFAHYTARVNSNPHAKDTRWTRLVKFDHEWRQLGCWAFPAKVIERFEPHSCSGGSWGPNGNLFCTGHDRGEMYELKLPRAGGTLELTRTWSVPFTGQGIAWDHSQSGTVFGIDRPQGEVIAVKVPALTQGKPRVAHGQREK
jgi:outer membrane protein assembly factor BamB